MRIVSVEVKNNNAFQLLRNLEINKIIKILPSENDSPALEGEPLSIQNFKQWIREAENQPTVSLIDAKQTWAKKKEQLRKITK